MGKEKERTYTKEEVVVLALAFAKAISDSENTIYGVEEAEDFPIREKVAMFAWSRITSIFAEDILRSDVEMNEELATKVLKVADLFVDKIANNLNSEVISTKGECGMGKIVNQFFELEDEDTNG